MATMRICFLMEANLSGQTTNKKMSRKVVVITGCSEGGIGHHLCLAFLRKGARVFATARRLESVASLVELGIETVALDVTDAASIKAAVEHVLQQAGRIDILVNNAGASLYGPLVEAPMEQVKRLYETNLFGVLALTQEVVPSMVRQGSGKIVNVGSVVGFVGTPYSGVYSSSKAALHALTDILRVELRPFNIDVLVVAPGAIRSNIADNARKHLEFDPKSLYFSAKKSIEQRSTLSQVDSTPTEEFAQKTVDAILGTQWVPYFVYGKKGWMLVLLSWFPKWIQDIALSYIFNMSEVKYISQEKEKAL